MREIDLHTHTNISDGSESPADTVAHAKALGLKAIAITDHDTANGVPEAKAAGEKLGIEVVGGLELGCGWNGKEVHMLAYDIDPYNEKLNDTLEWIVTDRDERNKKMVDLMAKDGIIIDLDELKAEHPGSIIGRPHFALCLIRAGLADSVQDAFVRYLDPGRKYYIRRHFLSVEEAAELIRGAGGVSSIAHPMQYRLDDEGMTELMEKARDAGVSGLECYYSGYSPEVCARLKALAAAYGFCATEGSDWHGSHKPHIEMGSGMHGELNAPYELLAKLREREKCHGFSK